MSEDAPPPYDWQITVTHTIDLANELAEYVAGRKFERIGEDDDSFEMALQEAAQKDLKDPGSWPLAVDRQHRTGRGGQLMADVDEQAEEPTGIDAARIALEKRLRVAIGHYRRALRARIGSNERRRQMAEWDSQVRACSVMARGLGIPMDEVSDTLQALAPDLAALGREQEARGIGNLPLAPE